MHNPAYLEPMDPVHGAVNAVERGLAGLRVPEGNGIISTIVINL